MPDDKLLEYFRERLKQQRNQLIEQVQKTEDYGRAIHSESETMDLADKASSSYMKELMFSLSNTERRFLQSVSDALLGIENGTYGKCRDCEREIGRKRLEAVPWAQLCIDCQQRQERENV